MPAIVLEIVAVIQAIVKNAPDIVKAFAAVKTFINGLFGAGAITKAQQDDLMAHVEAVLGAHLLGNPPPEWTVEPDPAS